MGAVKPMYAVGIDAGSRRTRVVICTYEDGRVRFLGAGVAESQGWLKGRIANQGEVADSVLAALRAAEQSAGGVSVESAVVGMGGPTTRGHSGRGVLELGYVREIDRRDVTRVVDRASRVQLQEDRMLLQLFPQDFVVDDHPGHRDPRKMLAARLEINVHLITCSIQEHNSLVGAVNQAHLTVEETVFEALAACYAVVMPEARREGIAVVNWTVDPLQFANARFNVARQPQIQHKDWPEATSLKDLSEPIAPNDRARRSGRGNHNIGCSDVIVQHFK